MSSATPRRVRRRTCAAALAGALFLSACGNNGQPDAGAGAAAPASGEVGGTIDYGFWGNAPRAEVTTAVVDAFQAANSGTTVNTTFAEYQGYIEKLTVQSSAGELPCVSQMQSTFMATYASKNVLRPLDDLIEAKTIDVSQIPQAVLDTGKVDGKQYMIPTGAILRQVVYNGGLAEQFGVSVPTERGSFEDYATWALEAQPKLPAGTFATENDAWNLFTFYSWVEGHGKQMFDGNQVVVDQDTVVQFFDYWERLRQAGAALPADRIADQSGSLATTPFAKGEALASTRDIGQIATTEDTLKAQGLPSEVSTVSNPVTDGAKSGNVPGTNGLSISANCTNVPTAAAFIDFFENDPTAGVAFKSANGVAITRTQQDALNADDSISAAVKRALTTYAELAEADDVATVSFPAGYQSLQAALQRAYEDVAFGRASSTDAAANFLAEAKQAIS